MKFGSLLDQLAVDLNDAAPGHEFTTWSKQQIRAYLEEAIQTAFIERPDLFTDTRVIKLKPCTVVQDTCDCTHVRRVIGQSTKDGRVFKTLRPKKNDDKLRWTGRTCPVSPKDFELQEYSIDNVTDKLWVYPQVPAGLDVYIAVECAILPETFGDDYDIPGELQAAVVQWVLFRAKMVDGENNTTIIQVANAHKQTFWELLNAQVNSKDIIAEKDDDRPTSQRRV